MRLKSNEEGKCPFCNSYALDYDMADFIDDMVYYKWHCNNCEHEGIEYYRLEFIGHNVIDDNGNNVEIEDSMIEEE